MGAAFDQLVLYQVGYQRDFIALRLRMGLLGGFLIQQLCQHQLFGQPAQVDDVVHWVALMKIISAL